MHATFPATDAQTVRDFHRAAVDAGYESNGLPGERPEYHWDHMSYYAACVLDPDGTNVESVFHAGE